MNILSSMPPSPEPGPVTGANFSIRLLAKLIDFSIVFIIALIFSIPKIIRVLKTGDTTMEAVKVNWWVEIPVDLAILIGVVLMWRYWQTTPGKRLFHLKIVDLKTGGRPHPARLVLRFFGYVIALVPIPLRIFTLWNPGLDQVEPWGVFFESWMLPAPLLLGFLWILIDSRNRGWHDLMSGTVTVERRPEAAPPPLPKL